MDHLADAPIANILILAGVIFLAVGLFGRIGGFIGSVFGNIEAGKNSRVLAGVLGVLLVIGGAWMHEDSHKSAASTSAPAAPVTTASITPTVSPAPSVVPTTTAMPPTTPPATNAPNPAPATTAKRPVTPNAARDPKPAAPAPTTQPTASVAPSTPVPAAERVNVPAPPRENPPAPAPIPVFDHRLLGVWTNLVPLTTGISRIDIEQVGQDLEARIVRTNGSVDQDLGTHKIAIRGNTPAFDLLDGNVRRFGALDLQGSGVMLLHITLSVPGTPGVKHVNRVMVKTLSDKMRDAFRGYFGAPGHKAFAMASNGSWAYQYRAGSADGAMGAALEHCAKKGGVGCRVILVDEDAMQ